MQARSQAARSGNKSPPLADSGKRQLRKTLSYGAIEGETPAFDDAPSALDDAAYPPPTLGPPLETLPAPESSGVAAGTMLVVIGTVDEAPVADEVR